MKAWKMDVVTGVGVFAFSMFVLASSIGFPPAKGTDFGPALFPRVIAVILVLLGVLVLLKAARVRAGTQTSDDMGDALTATRTGWRNLAVTVFAVIAYIIIVDNVGFIPTTIVFLFALMKTYGLPILRCVLFACFITGFVYVLFSMLLRVVLP